MGGIMANLGPHAAAPSDRPRSADVFSERILLLVPHEPADDPRVGWVTSLCAAAAPTEVLSGWYRRHGPAVEFDGHLYTERFLLEVYIRKSWWLDRLAGLEERKLAQEFVATHQDKSKWVAERGAGVGRWVRYHLGGALRGIGLAASLKKYQADPFWYRARGLTAAPRLVICQDFGTLAAGIRLKRLFGCPVIYDAHEFTPEASVFCHPLEVRLWQYLERRLARQADAVVTVSPQLAQEFAKLYGLRCVLSVPNAAPLAKPPVAPSRPIPKYPIRFLVQGGANPGRGFETLLEGWRLLADPRAILYVRCPESAYLEYLRRQASDLCDKGLLHFLPAAAPDKLIKAAAFADVGIIPYPVHVVGRQANRNHLYCCPNKLSQYAQAGLAILSTNSVFVSACLQQQRCGLTYDSEQPASLARAVSALIADLAELQTRKANALRWARQEFHWEKQAQGFRDLIVRLYGNANRRTAEVRRLVSDVPAG
jgi:glycosyltransferase involved in cell wall biosynthesis